MIERENEVTQMRYRRFDDSAEFIDWCGVNHTQSGHKWNDHWKDANGTGFLGQRFNSFDDITRQANQGSPKIAKEVETLIEQIEDVELPEPVDIRRRSTYVEDEGDELSMERLYGGQPFWRTMKRRPSYGQQTKRVMVNMFTRGNRRPEEIHWRGVTAIAFAHILEQSGYQVDLWASDPTRLAYIDNYGSCAAVQLKGPNDPVDIEAIATLMSGWCYRSLWFEAMHCDHVPVVGGLGKSRIYRAEDHEILFEEEYNPEDNITISDVYSKWNAEYLLKQILGLYAEPVPEVEPEEEETPVLVRDMPPPKPISRREQRRRDREYARLIKRMARENRKK